jgi:membrane protein DedA with SNARE-associated domain
MEQFLNEYGYLALTVGTFFEGETAILVASSLISQGLFGIPATIFFGFAGSFISDWIYYGIGYYNGKYFLSKRPKLQQKLVPVQNFFRKNSTQILLSYRFLYGFRIIIPISIGLSKIKPSKFLLFSIVSGVLWASVVSSIGYTVGRLFEIKTQVFEENIFLIIGGFALFGLLIGYVVKKIATRKIIQEESADVVLEERIR